jgi:hypothetical protein
MYYYYYYYYCYCYTDDTHRQYLQNMDGYLLSKEDEISRSKTQEQHNVAKLFFKRRCMKTITRKPILQQYKDIKRF